MLFYWFSVGAEKGEIIWSANCDPEGQLMRNHIVIKITVSNLKVPSC
jgi:hypothetical protein